MVLIISKQCDPSTENVIDWLYYYNEPFLRINGSELFSTFSNTTFILGNSFYFIDSLKIDKGKINSIKSIWFRRDENYTFLDGKFSEISLSNKTLGNIEAHLKSEIFLAKEATYSIISNNISKLGNSQINKNLNKIEVLNLAKHFEIDIPTTLVTNKKIELVRFVEKYKNVITKSIGNGFNLHFENGLVENVKSFATYTEKIDHNTLINIPETFFYSLFQELIIKEVDIRVFYLDGSCYPMAIFSFNDNSSTIDSRKYKKTRKVPFKIPNWLEVKINKLMNSIGLNTGSLDFIKTLDDRYIFLEVNPVGQFDMTSYHCNYHLDKRIAEFLLNGK